MLHQLARDRTRPRTHLKHSLRAREVSRPDDLAGDVGVHEEGLPKPPGRPELVSPKELAELPG